MRAAASRMLSSPHTDYHEVIQFSNWCHRSYWWHGILTQIRNQQSKQQKTSSCRWFVLSNSQEFSSKNQADQLCAPAMQNQTKDMIEAYHQYPTRLFPTKNRIIQFPSAGQKGQKDCSPSSNGSWFCPMMCLILTPSFFLRSTGQGVQQASTGCSQMNPEMPLLWQRLATSIREAMHVTGAWNQVTNLALSASCGNEPWKDKKMRNFRSWLVGVSRSWRVHWSISESRWDDYDSLLVAKAGTKRVPTVVALATLHEFLYNFEGSNVLSRLWVEGLTNTSFKMLRIVVLRNKLLLPYPYPSI